VTGHVRPPLRRWLVFVLLAAVVLLAIFLISSRVGQRTTTGARSFSGERAYQDVLAQMAMGPRTVASAAHAEAIKYISDELTRAGWQVGIQSAEIMGHHIQNITARRGEGLPYTLIGAHYDSRLFADQDPDPSRRDKPVPGADDGASGVAVLLEVARALPASAVPVQLVFFDAEDNGDIPGWDWLLGSQAYVAAMTSKPNAMILLDMVGDANPRFTVEQNSDPDLTASIWKVADQLGYGSIFVSIAGPRVLDDHVPFIQAGIRSVDIIDLEYPYWHTTADTADKVSADSLTAVGTTLLAWLENSAMK
jgi:glutaminyl-peptide cyclotransferase